LTYDARLAARTVINLISQCDYDAAAHLAGLPKYSADMLSSAFGGVPFDNLKRDVWLDRIEVWHEGDLTKVRCPKIKVSDRMVQVEMSVDEHESLPIIRIDKIVVATVAGNV
jgi:hypothetical protein